MKKIKILFLLFSGMFVYSQSPGGVSANLSAWYKTVKTSPVTSMVDYSGNGHDALSSGPQNATIVTSTDVNYNSAYLFPGTPSASDNAVVYYRPPFVNTSPIQTAIPDFQFADYKIFWVVSKDALFALFSESKSSFSGTNSEIFTLNFAAPVNRKVRHTLNAARFDSDVTLPSIPNSEMYMGLHSRKVSTRFIRTRVITDVIEQNSYSGPNTSTYTTTAAPFIGARKLPNRATPFQNFRGKVAEIIFYKSDVGGTGSTEERQIESYLALKYGITLANSYIDSNGDTFWDYNLAGNFDKDIAGIGRDDTSALNQKQSHSVNPNYYLSMGLGSVEVDNETNTNTFAADRNFLVWGSDNNNVNNPTTGYTLNANLTEKLIRDWRVQETGNVGNVKIEISNTKVINSFSTTPIDLSVVVSDDINYSVNIREIPMMYNAIKDVWEATVDFTTGVQYFSIFNNAPFFKYMRHGKHFKNNIENPMKF